MKTLQTCFKTNTHTRQMLPAIRLHGDQLSGFRDVLEMFAPTLTGLLGLFGSIVDSELLFKLKSDPYKLVSCRVMPACGRARAQANHVGMFTNLPVVPASHTAKPVSVESMLHSIYITGVKCGTTHEKFDLLFMTGMWSGHTLLKFFKSNTGFFFQISYLKILQLWFRRTGPFMCSRRL